jgi:hypothetical protein
MGFPRYSGFGLGRSTFITLGTAGVGWGGDEGTANVVVVFGCLPCGVDPFGWWTIQIPRGAYFTTCSTPHFAALVQVAVRIVLQVVQPFLNIFMSFTEESRECLGDLQETRFTRKFGK